MKKPQITKTRNSSKLILKILSFALIQQSGDEEKAHVVMAAVSYDSVCRNRDYAFVLGNSALDFKTVISEAYDTDLIMAGMVTDSTLSADTGFFTVLNTVSCESSHYWRLTELVSVDAVFRNRVESSEPNVVLYYYLVG